MEMEWSDGMKHVSSWFMLHQVGDITLFLLRCMILSRSRLPMRLCSLPTHSPGICILVPIELSMAIIVGECMRDAWVIN